MSKISKRYIYSMIVKRSTTSSLKFSNKSKLDSLRFIMRLYRELVNSYINILWGIPEHHKKIWIPKDIQKSVPTKLSAVLQQKAGAEALRIIKSQINNNKKQKIKPTYNSNVLELDQRSVTFLEKESSFDLFIKFKNLGMRTIISCPVKLHAHYFKYNNWIRKKTVRIINRRGHFFIEFIFEKDIPQKETKRNLGIDIGVRKLMTDSNGNKYGTEIEPLIQKIRRKKNGSKGQIRALRERNEYINRIIKELPIDSNFILEDLKGLKNKRNKRNSSYENKLRSKLHFWNYRKVLNGIKVFSEVVGVQCLKVPPAYTSQTCPVCGNRSKLNRPEFGEIFKCILCGYENDSDIVGALNILKRGNGVSREDDGFPGDREVSSVGYIV